MTIYKHSGTGSGAMLVSASVPQSKERRVDGVTVKLSAAPTTAGTLTVTLNAAAGAEYDAVLYQVDPATSSATSIVWQPDPPLWLVGGDAIDVAYANANSCVYGVQIALEGV